MWLGTYEHDYPRTAVLTAGLRELGHEVVTAHHPVWERQRHKAGGFLSVIPLATAAGRWTSAWVRLARRHRALGPVDAIVAGYPAQLDALPAARIARRRGVPLVVDMMVSLVDTFAGDRGRVGRLGARALAAIDASAVRAADLVMCDTHANSEFIGRRFRVPVARRIVVPVGAEDVFRHRPEVAGDQSGKALFVGKLAPLHGLATVLAAARTPGCPPIRLIGDGQLGGWLRNELARDRPVGLEHVSWVPYAALPDEIAGAEISLGIFGDSEKASRVVPNKVWQAMAIGRAIVTADTAGIREVLTDERDALLVPVGDPAALAAALTRLSGDARLRARLGEAARDRFDDVGRPARVAGCLVAALDG
jgi:glycosyltransferase involved in cell wall biosynthesis